MDLQHGHFLAKMYVKTKELGPVGGACAGHGPLDLPMIKKPNTEFWDIPIVVQNGIYRVKDLYDIRTKKFLTWEELIQKFGPSINPL